MRLYASLFPDQIEACSKGDDDAGRWPVQVVLDSTFHLSLTDEQARKLHKEIAAVLDALDHDHTYHVVVEHDKDCYGPLT